MSMSNQNTLDHVLFNSINEKAGEIIHSSIERVQLRFDELLFEPNQMLDCIWFVISGLVAVVTVMQDGAETDGLIIGRGGALGLPASLGDHHAISRARVAVEGEAWLLSGEACRLAMSLDSRFNHDLMIYYQAIFAATVQITACNSAHDLRQRFSRFLLMCRDQLQSDLIPVRQDFVSKMLGVNRTSITPISRALQAEGAIIVRHGRIQIQNTAKLQDSACECHAVINARYPTNERLLSQK